MVSRLGNGERVGWHRLARELFSPRVNMARHRRRKMPVGVDVKFEAGNDFSVRLLHSSSFCRMSIGLVYCGEEVSAGLEFLSGMIILSILFVCAIPPLDWKRRSMVLVKFMCFVNSDRLFLVTLFGGLFPVPFLNVS